MSENVAFTVRRAAQKMRQDALCYRPGGWDETWRNAVAASWEECAVQMELYGAQEVPFISLRHMDPDAMLVIDRTGTGNMLWTAIVAAARAYIGGPY